MSRWSISLKSIALLGLLLHLPSALADEPSVVGCMSTACHGSNVPSAPIWQQAGKIWFDHDPHAQAYTSLLTETSARIVERLTNRRFEISSIEYREVLEMKCVSCHATESESSDHRVLGADCQVCHGNVSVWGKEHYAGRSSVREALRAKGSSGFSKKDKVDVESISTRVAICASCHVGELNRKGLDREVDHRLMAAGHPTMHFDFETFMRRYPEHWKADTIPVAKPVGSLATQGYERWRIGRIVAAETRLKLLMARAERAVAQTSRSSDWPELSEYSCYSCHRLLGHQKSQPSNAGANGILVNGAKMQWDQWTLAQLDTALGVDEQSEYFSIVDRLKSHTEQLAPDPKSVSASADALRRWLQNALQQDPAQNHARIAEISNALRLQVADNSSLTGWESATQWYITTQIQCEAVGIANPFSSIPFQKQLGNMNLWNKWTPIQSSAFPPPSQMQFEALQQYRKSLLNELRANP